MNREQMAANMPKTLLWCCLLLTGQLCFAENIPDAGQLLQEQKNLQLPETKNAALPAAPVAPVAIEGQQTVMVQKFVIQGNSIFSTATLHQLIASYEAKNLSFNELQQAANQISKYYADKGYSYSYAFLPAQNLNQGQVTIQVLEAVLNGVQIQNNTNTQPWLIQSIIEPLEPRQIFSDRQLEEIASRLDLLKGVKSSFAFTAGQAKNETVLKVDLEPTQKYQAYVGADNMGGKYTGEVRGTGGVRLNSLLGLGDQLSIDALSSGQHMNYGKIGYTAQVYGLGTQLGGSYSYLTYELGKELKNLGYKGSAKEASLWIRQSVVQRLREQTTLTLAYTNRQLEDDVMVAESLNHRKMDSLQLGLTHMFLDESWGIGMNQLAATATFGQLHIKNADVKAIDALTRKTDGDYLSILVKGSRLQKITGSNQLYISAEGFYSPDNLDSAEAYYVGGPSFMRGYKSSVFSASQGIASSVEFRQSLWSDALNQLNGTLFFDMAKLKLNAQTWEGSTEKNTASLRSAGAGLTWDNRFAGSFQALAGFALGDTPVQLSQRDDHQFWLNWQKTF
jgi:hemolysin activation/secretion protein